mmetsp:Transcript_10145/g.31132  ORF Transcript_10145/g.31132 Transcript_10145/m.31132 type:complete len:100 (-) Transcript_10145:2287-2586(-)
MGCETPESLTPRTTGKTYGGHGLSLAFGCICCDRISKLKLDTRVQFGSSNPAEDEDMEDEEMEEPQRFLCFPPLRRDPESRALAPPFDRPTPGPPPSFH